MSELFDIYAASYNMEHSLAHYGVKGMKWGVRQQRRQAARKRKRTRRSNEVKRLWSNGQRVQAAKKWAEYHPAKVGLALAATQAGLGTGLYYKSRSGLLSNGAKALQREAITDVLNKRAAYSRTSSGRKRPANRAATYAKVVSAAAKYDKAYNSSKRKFMNGHDHPDDHRANYEAMRKATRYMTAYQGVRKARRR